MQLVTSLGNNLLDLIPPPVRNSVHGTYNEIDTIVDRIFKGDLTKCANVNNNYLKSRETFIHKNRFTLSRDLLFYGTIAAVGYLIASITPVSGGCLILFAGFFIQRSFREENHLKNAIAQILNVQNWDQIVWDDRAEYANDIVTFNVGENAYRYYVGNGINPLGTMMRMDAYEVRIIWDHLHQNQQ